MGDKSIVEQEFGKGQFIDLFKFALVILGSRKRFKILHNTFFETRPHLRLGLI